MRLRLWDSASCSFEGGDVMRQNNTYRPISKTRTISVPALKWTNRWQTRGVCELKFYYKSVNRFLGEPGTAVASGQQHRPIRQAPVIANRTSRDTMIHPLIGDTLPHVFMLYKLLRLFWREAVWGTRNENSRQRPFRSQTDKGLPNTLQLNLNKTCPLTSIITTFFDCSSTRL